MKKTINRLITLPLKKPAEGFYLKYMLCLLLFLAIGKGAFAQIGPLTLSTAGTSGTFISNVSITLIPPFSTSGSFSAIIQSVPLPSPNMNYIITYTPRVSGILTSTGLNTASSSNAQLQTDVQYFDGLGRPLQSVQVQGSSSGQDLVQPYAYDALGREATKYLPYVAGADGSYKSSALTTGTGVLNFYNPAGSSGTQQSNGIVRTVYPYAVTGFEPSPLNRVVEQGAPGATWQLPAPGTGNASSNGNTLRMLYLSNNITALTDTGNSYLAINYTATTGTGQVRTIVNNGAYAAGKLYVTVHRSENWKGGRGGTTEEYKDMQGRVVLKRTYNWNSTLSTLTAFSTYYIYDEFGNLAFVLPPGTLPDAASPTTLQLTNWCYQYRYDERNRLTQKKIPGKGWEYTVYNQLDKPVLTQDAVQAATNQWTVTKYDELGRVIMTGLWNAGSTYTLAALQSNIYAGAQWDVRNTSNTTTGYTITSYPTPLTSMLSINYYDDYTAPNIPSTCIAPSTASNMTRGVPTASFVNILGTTNMLPAVTYYDDLGRTLQVYKQHNQGGGATLSANNYDVVANTYNFTNTINTSTRKHYNATYTTGPLATILNTYVYDQRNRKTQSFEQINGGTNVLLAQDAYNELGQLLTKHLHSENGSAPFLQDVGYTYNERGWLRTSGTSANLFYMELRYDTPDGTTSHQFNGNISEMLYTGASSGSKTFSYVYDQLNRLNNAVFTGNTLNETVSYDLMGNITNLTRTGTSAATLVYKYTDVSGNSTGNLLQTVTNSGAAYRTYAYDANGDGMTKGIGYNLLNLPQTVTLGGSTIATYTYDATGAKLRNTGSDGTWDYIDGIVYNNPPANTGSVIKFIQTETGRVIPNGTGVPNGTTSYHYEHNLTDNLGNVRVTFDKNASTGLAEELQEDQYYAFGLRNGPLVDVATNNRYLYNGKERQTDLTDQYDYGARFYDPVIARWTTPDPMTERAEAWSPYTYVLDNPLKLFDPDGKFPYPVTIRAFAPPGAFSGAAGLGFNDDSRGYSAQSNASSRITQTFTVDPSARSITGGAVSSSDTHWDGHDVGNATNTTDAGGISNQSFLNDGDNSIATLSSDFTGSNPAFHGLAPDIEVKSDVLVEENKKDGFINVSVDLSSKQFPATEALIGDSKGQNVFVTGAAAFGGPNNLAGGDVKKVASGALRINIDGKGNFKSVVYGGKTYTVSDWNKAQTAKPAGPYPRDQKDKQQQ